MDLYSGYINKLIDEFAALPGVGMKSAQRLAFHIINMPQGHAEKFADTIIKAKQNVRYCKQCFTLTNKISALFAQTQKGIRVPLW